MLGQHGYLSTPSFNLKLEGGTTTQFPAHFRTLLRHSHSGHIAKSFLQGSRVFFHAINQGASILRLEFHFFYLLDKKRACLALVSATKPKRRIPEPALPQFQGAHKFLLEFTSRVTDNFWAWSGIPLQNCCTPISLISSSSVKLPGTLGTREPRNAKMASEATNGVSMTRDFRRYGLAQLVPMTLSVPQCGNSGKAD